MLIPVIIGVIVLGRSFDMNIVDTTSYYIFDPKLIQANVQTIPRSFVSSQYRFLEASSDVNSFLSVDGELSLKVKNGDIGLRGIGNYMSNTINRDQTVEMLISVYHETLTETFPTYIKQRDDWKKRPQKDVGTHYIRSITYGGQLIISYQLQATKSEYMEDIKAAVSANLQLSGSIDGNVTGNLEKLSKEVSDKARVVIQAYATAGAINVPTTIEDVLQLVDDYPNLVKEINQGKGAPLKVELVPISTLHPDYTDYLRNEAIDGLANEATDKYDDIRVTMQDYKIWEKEGQIWTPEQQKLINAFQKQLKKAKDAMADAISALDPSMNGDLHQLDEAFEAYGSGGDNIPNRYARWLLKLKYYVENKPFQWFPYTKAVTHYVHWGNTTCSLPNTSPVFTGYAATAANEVPKRSFGNGGNYVCLNSQDPALDTRKLTGNTTVSQINGILYETPEKKTGQVFCAFCRLENATSVFTIAGRTDCPGQMKLEYSGYLTTNRAAGTASSFICLDRDPVENLPLGQQNYVVTGEDKSAGLLSPVWISCPDCDDTDKKYVSCVVCSR